MKKHVLWLSWLLRLVVLIVLVVIVFLSRNIESYVLDAINSLEHSPLFLHSIIFVWMILGAYTAISVCAPLAAQTSINPWILYVMYMILPTCIDYFFWYKLAQSNGDKLDRVWWLKPIKNKLDKFKSSKVMKKWLKKPFWAAFFSKALPYAPMIVAITGGLSAVPPSNLVWGFILGEFVLGSTIFWSLYFVGSTAKSVITSVALILLFVVVLSYALGKIFAKREKV